LFFIGPMRKYFFHFLLLLIGFYSCKIGKSSYYRLKPKETLGFEIPSNLGQGYQWQLFDTSRFSILEHSSRPNPDTLVSTDLEKFVLRSKGDKGKFILVFYLRRPFDPIEDTVHSAKTIKKVIIK